jgi:predicted RNA-binding Zn-ribbon protein involved in translation (DUF1610 family)
MLLDIFIHLIKTYAGAGREVKPRERCDGRGFFYCPACQGRQPALLIHVDQIEEVRNGDRELTEIYVCETCRRRFPAASTTAYDYSDSPESTIHTCFRCGGVVPGHLWRCPKCGFQS